MNSSLPPSSHFFSLSDLRPRSEVYGEVVNVVSNNVNFMQIVVLSKMSHNAEEGRINTVMRKNEKISLSKVKLQIFLWYDLRKFWRSLRMQFQNFRESLCLQLIRVTEMATTRRELLLRAVA